jgi:hypothetical protein
MQKTASRPATVMLVMLCNFFFMVLNATFNNISVISWLSVLIMEETEKTTDMLYIQLPHASNSDVSDVV